jgi:hypothetical protein
MAVTLAHFHVLALDFSAFAMSKTLKLEIRGRKARRHCHGPETPFTPATVNEPRCFHWEDQTVAYTNKGPT